MNKNNNPTPNEENGRVDEWTQQIHEFTHSAGKLIGALLMGLARILAPIAAVIVVGALALYGFLNIEHLGGQVFHADSDIAALGGLVTIGTTLILAAFIAFYHASHAARGVALIFLVVWLILTIFLVLTNSAFTSGLAAFKDPTMQDGGTASILVPAEITFAGSFMFAALAGISLLPATLVPIVAMRAPSDKFHSTFSAVAHMLGVAVKFSATTAGIVAEMFFGMHYGITPLYTVIASFVIGFGFLWAQGQADVAHVNGDTKSLAKWAGVGRVFGAYMAFISFESVYTLAGWDFLFGNFLIDFAKVAYAASLPIFIVIYHNTFFSSKKIALSSGDENSQIDVIPVGSRAAGFIAAQRRGWSDLNGAMRGLPAPEQQFNSSKPIPPLTKEPVNNNNPAAAEVAGGPTKSNEA